MEVTSDPDLAIKKAVGRQIRKYRRLADLTQDDLCQKCGIFRTYLSRLENGIANPTLTVLNSLARNLDVDLRALIHES